MAWNYQREEANFDIPVGTYRIRVRSAELTTSKTSGNDMLALQFEVSGLAGTLYHYIPFLRDRPEVTNRMLTAFFDSFPAVPLPTGDISPQYLRAWIGKVGACVVGVDKNDNSRTRLSRFIPANKQDALPPWRDASGNVTVIDAASGFEEVSNERSPF